MTSMACRSRSMQTKKQIDDILAAINGKEIHRKLCSVEGGLFTDFTGGETLTIRIVLKAKKVSKDLGVFKAEGVKCRATIVPKFKVDARTTG